MGRRLDTVDGSCLITEADVMSALWQPPVAAEDEDEVAFTIPCV